MLNTRLGAKITRSGRESMAIDWQTLGREFVLESILETSAPNWFSVVTPLLDLRNAVRIQPISFTLKEVAERDEDKRIGATIESKILITENSAYAALVGATGALCSLASELQKTAGCALLLKPDAATGYTVVIEQQRAGGNSDAQHYLPNGEIAEFVEVPTNGGTHVQIE